MHRPRRYGRPLGRGRVKCVKMASSTDTSLELRGTHKRHPIQRSKKGQAPCNAPNWLLTGLAWPKVYGFGILRLLGSVCGLGGVGRLCVTWFSRSRLWLCCIGRLRCFLELRRIIDADLHDRWSIGTIRASRACDGRKGEGSQCDQLENSFHISVIVARERKYYNPLF